MTCPAGEVCGEGVFCKIEAHYLDARTEPSSVARYCTGDHTECSTFLSDWRARQVAKQTLRDALEAEVT